ncbi:hypothetical protein BKA69DRAFT_1083822 [Paraphysoderma sedebokerense]|nr:hypothetical protein BKA69DRAFT_1083822 [Paraphysoderma sedebokerense]
MNNTNTTHTGQSCRIFTGSPLIETSTITDLGVTIYYVACGVQFLTIFALFYMHRKLNMQHSIIESVLVLLTAAVLAIIQAFLSKTAPAEAAMAKYAAWSLSTPVIIIQIVELLDGREFLGPAVFLDILCILTGFLAWVSTSDFAKWSFFAISCVSLIYLFSIIGTLFVQTKDFLKDFPQQKRWFIALAILFFGSWLLYPVTWVIGYEGLNLVNEDILAVASLILNILSKDLTELLISYSRHILVTTNVSTYSLPAAANTSTVNTNNNYGTMGRATQTLKKHIGNLWDLRSRKKKEDQQKSTPANESTHAVVTTNVGRSGLGQSSGVFKSTTHFGAA